MRSNCSPTSGRFTWIAWNRAAAYETENRSAYLTSQELARLNRIVARVDKSKSDFVAVAAHEFKTPLALIEGYAAMLDELLPAEMEQFHSLLAGMQKGLKRLARTWSTTCWMSL